MSPRNAGYELQTLSNAVTLLETLAAAEEPLGISELERKLGLSRPTTYRLLYTLKQRGLVQQDPETSKYSLGLKLWELGWAAVERMGLRKAAHAWLERLKEEGQETALLAVLDESEVVYIDKVDSTQPVMTYSRVGGRAPAHCTATGRVLLAFGDPEVAERVIQRGLPPFTQNSITDPTELRAELARIRQRGWALNREAWRLGVSSVAVPLWDYTGRPIAAIGLAGPADRFDENNIQRLVALLQRASADISANLGYLPQHHRPPWEREASADKEPAT